ncbi:MAG: hypothetical protein AAFY10_07805 [Pseudomonadota bacterium]
MFDTDALNDLESVSVIIASIGGLLIGILSLIVSIGTRSRQSKNELKIEQTKIENNNRWKTFDIARSDIEKELNLLREVLVCIRTAKHMIDEIRYHFPHSLSETDGEETDLMSDSYSHFEEIEHLVSEYYRIYREDSVIVGVDIRSVMHDLKYQYTKLREINLRLSSRHAIDENLEELVGVRRQFGKYEALIESFMSKALTNRIADLRRTLHS